jgi:ankyrin repeat protein
MSKKALNFTKLKGEFVHPVIELITGNASIEAVRMAFRMNDPPFRIDTKFGDGNGNILHRAVCVGHLKAVRYLLQTFPCLDINTPDDFGNTALHCAALTGNKKIIFYLLEQGARRDLINKYAQTAIDCYQSNNVSQHLRPPKV